MVVFLLGLVIVLGALVAVGVRVRWLRGTVHTSAEVLDIGSREEEGGGQYNFMETVYLSRLKFAKPDGSVGYFEQRQGSRPRFAVGDSVTIRYHRTDPSGSAEVPYIKNELMVWFAIVACLTLGSAFLFGGTQIMRGRGTPAGISAD
jgi:hypothetical protein